MSRISRRFEGLKRDGQRALVTFVTAGDPDPSVTVGLMHELARAGGRDAGRHLV